MNAQAYQSVLEEKEAAAFVRRFMHLVTADLRGLALRALAEWQQIGIATPELLPCLAAIQQPDAGAWNGLLLVIVEARRKALAGRESEIRTRIERAAGLTALAEGWSRPVASSWEQRLRKLTGDSGETVSLGRCVQGAILAGVRAEMAGDGAGWSAAEEALRPLGEYLAGDPLGELVGAAGRDAGWAAPSHGEAGGGEAPAFSALLGKPGIAERDLRAMLERHVPADAAGILLGDFLLTGAVGEGGFGTVYAARQVSTGRKVAVKVLHDGMPAEIQARFAREASYLARFTHPHIVGVLAYGNARWTAPALPAALAGERWFGSFLRGAAEKSYIAMEWIEGQTLDAIYRAAKADLAARPDVRRITQWFAQSAEALQAVHAGGLVHRDVKPSNLMLTAEGQIKLMDFGIARLQEDERTLVTTTGRVFGTLVYMSPEQIRAVQAQADIGPATDIYSLCATFYEIFTRTRLYEHDTQSAEMVKTRKLAGQPPSPPRAKAHDLPWEIEVILLGGLEAEIADRYGSMAGLARDLRHVLRDEPIEYRRPSPRRRAELLYRRHKPVARVLAAALLVAVIAGVAGTSVYRQSLEQRRQAEALSLEERGRQELLAGQGVLAAGHLSAAYSLGKNDPALRFLLAAALRELPAPQMPSQGHTKGVYTAEFDKDCGRVVTAGRDGVIKIWNVRSGACLLTLTLDPAHEASGAMFNPAGDRVVAADDGGNAAVWDANTGRRLHTFPRQSKAIYTPRFSPSGTRIVMACGEGLARIYNADSYVLLAELRPARAEPVVCAFFNFDESRIIMGCEDCSAYLWNGETYAEVGVLAATDKITRAVFSPDGSRIAVASSDPLAAVKFYDGMTGAPLHLFVDGPNTPARRIIFSPDGGKLVTSDREQISYFWDLQNGRSVPLPQDQGVLSAAFSHDGKLLGTAGRNGKVKLWNGDDGTFVSELSGHTGPVYQLVFSADDKQILTASEDGTARIWNTRNGVQLQKLDGHPATMAAAPQLPAKFLESAPADASHLLLRPLMEGDPITRADFTPDGQNVLLTREISLLRSAVTGERLLSINSLAGRETAACLSHDGQRMAVVNGNGEVAYESLDQKAYALVRLRSLLANLAEPGPDSEPGQLSLQSVAYSPNRKYLVVGGPSGAWVLDADTLQTLHTLPQGPGRADVVHAEFSPDSRRVVTAGTDGTAQLWDLSVTPPTSKRLAHKADVNWAAFSPDGQYVVTASNDGDAALWNAATGAPVRILNQGNTDYVLMAVFSPDGTRVATADRDYTARIYDVASGALVSTMRGHTNKVTSANFSPDGALLITSSEDGRAMLWETATGKQLAVLTGHRADVRWAEFSPDGTRAVTAGDDGYAFIWDTHLETRTPAEVAALLGR